MTDNYRYLKATGRILLYWIVPYLIPLGVYALNGCFEPNPFKWKNLDLNIKQASRLEEIVKISDSNRKDP